MELHWKQGATNGMGELYVNGAQVCVIANKNTVAYGDVNQVHFGLGELYNCSPTTIYCDCCAISKTKIGTEPAS